MKGVVKGGIEAYKKCRNELIRLHTKQRQLILEGKDLSETEKKVLKRVELKLMQLGQQFIRMMRKKLAETN